MKHKHMLLPSLLLAALAPLAFLSIATASPVKHSGHHQGRPRTTVRHHPAPKRVAPQGFAGDFPIIPFGADGARGSVRVTIRGGQVLTSVYVDNLPAGSVHAIHIHAGNCGSAYFGMHLYILGYLTANGAGAGSISGYGPSPYVPGDRYVIVYSSLAPAVIVGCANLGGLGPM